MTATIFRFSRGGRGAEIETRTSDPEIDALYPEPLRELSRRYWTPVSVAARAARWLTEGASKSQVLDIGAGNGKFCIVGALETTASFVGIEQRLHLVEAAREAAERAGVGARVTFVHGTATRMLLAQFSAYYLFNPFGENKHEIGDQMDATVELSRERFDADVRLVEDVFRRAPSGTRVVTYHGFGGRMPAGFSLERQERAGSDVLELWVKGRS